MIHQRGCMLSRKVTSSLLGWAHSASPGCEGQGGEADGVGGTSRWARPAKRPLRFLPLCFPGSELQRPSLLELQERGGPSAGFQAFALEWLIRRPGGGQGGRLSPGIKFERLEAQQQIQMLQSRGNAEGWDPLFPLGNECSLLDPGLQDPLGAPARKIQVRTLSAKLGRMEKVFSDSGPRYGAPERELGGSRARTSEPPRTEREAVHSFPPRR